MSGLARLAEFSDREFLHIVNDAAGDGGWVDTADVAAKLTASKPNSDRFTEAMHAAGSRLSWMRRFGVIERNAETRAWRITETGEQFLNGTLRRAVGKALPELGDAEMVEVLNQLAGRYQRAGRSTSILMRREWQRGTMRDRY